MGLACRPYGKISGTKHQIMNCDFFGICHSDEANALGYVCKNPPQSPFTKGGGCVCCDHGACSRSSELLPRARLVGNRESSVLLHRLNTQHLNNTILYFPTNIQIIKLYPILPCLPLGFCLSLISRAWIGAEGFPDQLLKPGVMGLQGSAIG